VNVLPDCSQEKSRTSPGKRFAVFAVGTVVIVTVSALKMDAIYVSEMSVNTVPATATTQHRIPDNGEGKDGIVPVHAINAYDGVKV
jgi:hypothetical protein